MRRNQLTAEEKVQIIEAYKRGDKTVVIQKEFNIGPGDLYRVLREFQVPLRFRDPNHPASSMATRKAAGMPTDREAIAKVNAPEVKEEPMVAGPDNEALKRIEDAIGKLETKLDEMDKAIGTLFNLGYMDEGLKVDIIEAFLKSGDVWVPRELAKKMLAVIESIDGV